MCYLISGTIQTPEKKMERDGAANFRGQFICTECEKMGKFTGAIANIDVGENDDYEKYYS